MILCKLEVNKKTIFFKSMRTKCISYNKVFQPVCNVKPINRFITMFLHINVCILCVLVCCKKSVACDVHSIDKKVVNHCYMQRFIPVISVIPLFRYSVIPVIPFRFERCTSAVYAYCDCIFYDRCSRKRHLKTISSRHCLYAVWRYV